MLLRSQLGGVRMRKLVISLLVVVAILSAVFLTGCSTGQAICGTHSETYTTTVKGCDGMENCRCLHESWGGLGACDSCQCYKQVSNC